MDEGLSCNLVIFFRFQFSSKGLQYQDDPRTLNRRTIPKCDIVFACFELHGKRIPQVPEEYIFLVKTGELERRSHDQEAQTSGH